jgi:hypothetical protein
MTQWIKIDYDNIDTSRPPFDGQAVDLWLGGMSNGRIPECMWGNMEDIGLYGYGWLDDIGNCVLYPSDKFNKVTHYMPLPEPPEDV